jgi:hypothetical protein
MREVNKKSEEPFGLLVKNLYKDNKRRDNMFLKGKRKAETISHLSLKSIAQHFLISVAGAL